MYSKVAGTALFLAVWVREAHCNGKGFVHGGFISTIADNAMGYSVHAARAQSSTEVTPRRGVTVHLSVDFLGSANIGQWLEFKPRVLRVGGSLAVVDCLVEADGKLIARADATFRLG